MSVRKTAGHMIDGPQRDAPRFPAVNEAAVADAIARVLQDWHVGPGDLGLERAWQTLGGDAKLTDHAAGWRPWRSYAANLLCPTNRG